MHNFFNKTGLVLLSVALLGLLGTSYAGYTGELSADTELSTGSMDFEFIDMEVNEDFLICIQKGENGNIQDICADIDYDGKFLRVTDMGPIDMSWLEDGDLRIIIRYGIKASNEHSIMKAAATGKNEDAARYIGSIPLDRISRTPRWYIENGQDIWGSGDDEIDSVPQIVYSLLPETLGDFEIYQVLTAKAEDDGMQGIIILVQTEVPVIIPEGQVTLSQFYLPEELLQEISASKDLVLSVHGCYGFEIPINLDQFNAGGWPL